jgi:hypothetical protein
MATTIILYVFLAGVAGAALGILLQLLGSVVFSHFKYHDTKELAGLAGLRISAVFAIAAGLIFSGSHAHYVEAKINLLNEVRLIGTMYVLVSDTPGFPNSQAIRANLLEYTKVLATNLDEPETADKSAEATNQLLVKICRLAAPDNSKAAAMPAWLRNEIQNSCSQLIELRGKKRIWMLTSNVETPFWIFFFMSFGFLAFLLGVFEKNPLNRIFAALFYFAVGATAILIYWMADPYHGPSRISSAPLEKLVARMHEMGKAQ